MADGAPPSRRLRGRALLPLLVGLAFTSSSRAEIKVTPTLSATETWTDNVNLAPADRAYREWVGEVVPGLVITENTPRLQLSFNYQLHRYFYSDKNAPNLHDSSRSLQGALKSRLVEDLLFLDASANRSQTAISAFGPQVADNPYTTVNRTEVSTWSVSPYLTRHLGSTADLLVRYTRDSVDTGRDTYGNTKGSATDVALSSSGERTLGWNLRYDHQDLNDRLAGDSSSTSTQAGLSWQVQPSLAFTGSAGYDDYDYQSLGGRTRGRSWNVGFHYTPSPRTSLTMSYGHRYFGKSRALAAMHRSRHTVWNITYDESVTTTRQQFLLPATVDTAALLDRMFASTYTDAALRRQAVDAYMAAAGLPPSLANNINYLSNRYMLQQQFRISAGFTGARSLLMLSAYDMRRNGLSVQQSDSQLLGSNLVNLNDNTRQRGLEADLSYRLSSRTDATAQVSTSHSDSLTTGIRQNNRTARLGLRRQFASHLQGAVELRRIQGGPSNTAIINQKYTENAVSATLSKTF